MENVIAVKGREKNKDDEKMLDFYPDADAMYWNFWTGKPCGRIRSFFRSISDLQNVVDKR